MLSSIWPFHPPTPKVDDANITIPPELKASLQQILDNVSAAVYYSGVKDGVVAVLIFGLVAFVVISLLRKK